jgi:hypothetical protein
MNRRIAMARASDGSRRAWGAHAAGLLAAIAMAGAPAPVDAGDVAHDLLLDLGSAAQLQIHEDVELAIVKPAVSAVPYLGTAPLKAQLVYGAQPSKVIFAFERLQASGWQALGTLETGWNLVPPLVPGSFLQATGRYRVRVAPGDSNARRVVTPVERDWSPWREFSFQAGNSVPSGVVTAPGVLAPGKALTP